MRYIMKAFIFEKPSLLHSTKPCSESTDCGFPEFRPFLSDLKASSRPPLPRFPAGTDDRLGKTLPGLL